MGDLRSDRATAPRRLHRAVFWMAALAAFVGGTRGTQDAVANGDTRTLNFHHVHTKESASVTFKRNGSYDSQALSQLNWILRDWRSDEQTKMDPRLFDIIWEVQRSVGSSEPIHINSAYRSPATNGMLRRRSRGVSKFSQHMNGRAMDFYLPDVDMARVRAIAMRLQAGGVGYYPSSYSSFVHLDSGSVRSWPRMTRDQLVRLFPNEKTVHLPKDGKPLAGYEEAKAEIVARGGSVHGYAYAEASSGPRKSLWAMIFGGDEEEDAEYYQTPNRNARGRVAGASQPQLASAYVAASSSDDGGSRSFFIETAPEPAPSRRASNTQLTAASSSASPLGATSPDAASEADAPRLALAPLPPKRPDDVVSAAALSFAPTPPNRPVELAALGFMPLGDIATAVPATGMVAHPPPPARPASLGRPDEPVTTAAPSLRDVGPAADDRAQLRALFAAVASQAPAAQRFRVATARTKHHDDAPSGFVADRGAGLNLGFSPKPAADLGMDRFAGPAVKPLPVLR